MNFYYPQKACTYDFRQIQKRLQRTIWRNTINSLLNLGGGGGHWKDIYDQTKLTGTVCKYMKPLDIYKIFFFFFFFFHFCCGGLVWEGGFHCTSLVGMDTNSRLSS